MIIEAPTVPYTRTSEDHVCGTGPGTRPCTKAVYLETTMICLTNRGVAQDQHYGRSASETSELGPAKTAMPTAGHQKPDPELWRTLVSRVRMHLSDELPTAPSINVVLSPKPGGQNPRAPKLHPKRIRTCGLYSDPKSIKMSVPGKSSIPLNMTAGS